uniref:Putative serine/threonine-protein kinase ddb g0278509-like isoform x1 n=1 Tax=Tabanus bromius TaxID=304241 RepID=A0A0K8TRY2_TABBR
MRPPHSTFGNDITNTTHQGSNDPNNNDDPNGIPPHIARMGGTRIMSRIAGHGVIRVVERCEEAKENRKLDLSECELMQVPDAVYHLMRHTELKTCDLSFNVIKKIPPKFAVNFNFITDLDLSHNQISKLPDEWANLKSLQRLNISHNSFIALPSVVFKMPKLEQLHANNNGIIEIDTDQMIESENLELVDLRFNPLTRSCFRKLVNAKVGFRIELSENSKEEDW